MVIHWILIVTLSLIKSEQDYGVLSLPPPPYRTVVIPVLPRGKQLIFSILSTWGDRHYVGLNGIEVFSDDGSHATIKTVCHTPDMSPPHYPIIDNCQSS